MHRIFGSKGNVLKWFLPHLKNAKLQISSGIKATYKSGVGYIRYKLHCMCWPLGIGVNDTVIKSENLHGFNIEEVRFS